MFALLVLPALAFAGTQLFTTPGTYTLTVPAGVTSINVLTVGGGGGGGGGGVGNDGWGGGAGGGCGGGVSGQTLTVSPGQQFSVTVGAGGAGGGNGENGISGGSSAFGALSAQGGSYGGTGHYGYPNIYGPPGGTGGGSGGGGGGNPFCSSTACFDVPSYSGGSDGSQPSHAPGVISSGWYSYSSYPPTGYCTGNGWSVQPSQYVTNVSSSPGSGGWAPNSDAYCGGGGGGGVIIDGSTEGGQSGYLYPYFGYGPACETPNGGAGYGGGGGGSFGDSSGSGGAGAGGVVYAEWISPPSCTVSLSPNPSAYSYQGTPVTLSWSFANASTMYINNVGYVGMATGTTAVASQSTTDYTCSAGNGTSTSTTPATLTVTPPAAPTATIAASSSSILTRQSTNLTASFAAGSGDSITGDNIDEPYGTGVGANTNPGSKTITFSTTTPGTYTFYAMAQTDYYSSWAAYASTTITVTQAQTCSPQTVYECNSQTIVASSTDQYCNHTLINVTTCVSPQFCQAGSNSCLYPAISFNPSGNQTGQLQLIPDIVGSGESAKVYWNVTAQSCTVQGSNGDAWSGLSGAQTSKSITQETSYTLTCSAPGDATTTETESVNVAPRYEEI